MTDPKNPNDGEKEDPRLRNGALFSSFLFGFIFTLVLDVMMQRAAQYASATSMVLSSWLSAGVSSLLYVLFLRYVSGKVWAAALVQTLVLMGGVIAGDIAYALWSFS